MEALVINGSPGAGKNTIANAIAEKLRLADQQHTVIDVDELGRLYPENHDEIMWQNLTVVVQNYMVLENIKLILPVCLDSQDALDKLKAAVPANKLTICELTAPVEVLESRVTAREPNAYWQEKLRKLVRVYNNMPEKFADFQVNTEKLSPEQVAQQILSKLAW